MRPELKIKMLSGKLPVAQIELKYINIQHEFQVKEAEKHIVEDESGANHVIDWFECPGCEKTSYLMLEFNPEKNIFEELGRIEKESEHFKCPHCELEFRSGDDGFIFVDKTK